MENTEQEWTTLSMRYDIQNVAENSSQIKLFQKLLDASDSDVIDFSLCDFNNSIDIFDYNYSCHMIKSVNDARE